MHIDELRRSFVAFGVGTVTKDVFYPKRLFTRNCVNNATREWADSIVEEGDGFRAYGEENKV